MLVSVVIPACDAVATIARCLAAVLAQTHADWEAIVVADDRRDYAALLSEAGIADRRLRFLSTGAVRSGCDNARNLGLAAATGEVIAFLDADDVWEDRRLELLAPLAARHGAVADRVRVVMDEDDTVLYTAPTLQQQAIARLSAEALLNLNAPLFPVVHRALSRPRPAGIVYADDVVANLQLIERLRGALPLFPEALCQYRVRRGSLCHDDNSGAAFDLAYARYLGRLREGNAFGLAATRAAALAGLERKRMVNRLFCEAQRRRPELTFQEFVAPYGGSAERLLGALAPAAVGDPNREAEEQR